MRHELLTSTELATYTRASNLRGALSVATTWAIIFGSFALVALAPNVVTVALALILLGGRILALQILMHECAHRSLFATAKLNDVVGKWLCAAPAWGDVARYRVHHLNHHRYTGTPKDPDLGLVTPFPVSRASLRRKLLRDLFGVTGVSRVRGLLAMDLGYIAYTASNEVKPLQPDNVLRNALRHLPPVIITNAILFSILALAGHPELYLLWIAAYMTTYSLFLRVRSMAEHACTELSADQSRNTRTTHASWLARLTVAQHHVNYHLEHHLFMAVPHYRLPALHRRLGLPSCAGYGEVLRLVSAKPA